MARLFFFAAASAFLWPALPWTGALKFILQASPFVAICSSISLRHVGIGAIAGLAIAFAAILRQRLFCRYICPTGLLLEGAAKIGFAKMHWWAKCPPIGRYAALLTFFGAIAGYPFLLWMDPIALFSSIFTVRTAGTILSGLLAGLGTGILILLSLTSGRFWCARLCPLGGMQDLLARISSTKSLFSKKGYAAAEPKKEIVPMRRALLLGTAGIGIGLLAERTGAARGENAPLRPPGAVAEDLFAGLCTRCGNCARVCRAGIILPDSGQAGIFGLLAPVISYEKKYCLEDCADCTKVCPSGALQRLELEQKRRYIIGEALVDGSLCLVTLAQKDCDACVIACPFDAVRIHWDDELYVAYPLIDVSKCNGCGACEAACPVYGYKAIRIWKPATD
jgi:ferredoxin-type protein NapF